MRASTIKTYAYGHDFGNSDTNGVMIGNGWHQERQIPSVFAPGSWGDVENMAKSAGKSINEYLQFGHYCLEYVNEQDRTIEKYVGSKVFDDRLEPMTTRADQERYWRNGYSKEALMVGSGSCVQDEAYNLHVVTGLPIKLYTQDNARLVQNALKGTHTYRLNGAWRTVTVESVRVIMEGAGALIAYGTGQGDSMEGVIDIGGETTDLYVARSMRPYKALIRGTRLGVANIADKLGEKFQQDFHRSLNLDTCNVLLRQHVNRMPYIQIKDRNHMYIDPAELANLIENAISEIGTQIATFVSQIWGENVFDMQRILIVGGGAHYFKPAIVERFRNARSIPKPEMANAAGYASMAEAVMEAASEQNAGEQNAAS